MLRSKRAYMKDNKHIKSKTFCNDSSSRPNSLAIIRLIVSPCWVRKRKDAKRRKGRTTNESSQNASHEHQKELNRPRRQSNDRSPSIPSNAGCQSSIASQNGHPESPFGARGTPDARLCLHLDHVILVR
mmetsp:Transcript_660/g.1464  ORF Transcript_660/g.1464 Transcript_660/m.1464 type:complete len:129 (-) Transcript_660:16-402(-)